MRLPFDALSPQGLWLLAGLVPLVLLYVLKVRRERLKVSSTWLWASAQRDLLARSPFRKLVPQVPLLLQALALIFLALALARLATRSKQLVGDSVAIVVDASASMAALDESGKTRLELAREAASGVVSSLSPGSSAMLVEAGREVSVLSSFDEEPRRLRAAIGKIAPTDAEGDLGEAISLAAERLNQRGGSRRIVVVTDGALANEEALTNLSFPLDVIEVGTPVENVGIVRGDVRVGVDPVSQREQVQVFAMLASFASRPRELYVTARLENTDHVLASRRLLLEAGERTPVELAFTAAPGDIGKGLVVEIAPRDAFPTDDVFYARIPHGRRMPVVVASSRPSPWIERALASDPHLDVFRASPSELETDAIPTDALVVVEGECPRPSAYGLALLVVNPKEGPCLGVHVGKGKERPAITSWATNDPRLRFLHLDDLLIAKASILETVGKNQELVRTSEGPIVVDASTAGRPITIVGFDVGESDWPLKAGFVVFMRNIAEQAREKRWLGISGSIHPGEPMKLSVPPGTESVRVEGPGGFVAETTPREGFAVIAGANRAGLYHASFQGKRQGSTVVASNLASFDESDLRERPLRTSGSAAASITRDAVPEEHTDTTWAFALLALAFLAADVAWLTRKPKLPSRIEPPKPKLPDRRRA